jgi:hypothetical protein
VFRVAVGQGAAGLALALGASALLVVERPLGMWTLGLAAVAVTGAGAGYALLVQGAPDGGRPADAHRVYVRAGALVLVVTQLGTLAWGLVVLGPRLALILLLPPAIWLALRMGGRQVALVCGVGGAVVYAGFWVAVAWGAYVPLLDLNATGLALVDASGAALGLGLTLAAVTGAARWREHSDAAARARLYDLRLARAEIAGQRDQEEIGAELLAQALALALRGRGIDPLTLDGPLSLVTEGVEAVAERLRTLQKDREDRLRLEGAVRALTRALERAWLGAPWAWPEASGTMLDELIALLRTQRLPEHGALQAVRRGDTPSFASQPNVGAPSWSSWSSWPSPAPNDTSAPHSGTLFGAGRRDPLQH